MEKDVQGILSRCSTC